MANLLNLLQVFRILLVSFIAVRSLISIFAIAAIFISCEEVKEEHEKVDCDIAGYRFSLGEPVSEWKKDWAMEERNLPWNCDDIKMFSLTYEEHSFAFYFHKNQLIRMDMTVPRSELKGKSIEVAGERISYDIESLDKSLIKERNYYVEFRPFDFEGMEDISVTFGYKDDKKILGNCR